MTDLDTTLAARADFDAWYDRNSSGAVARQVRRAKRIVEAYTEEVARFTEELAANPINAMTRMSRFSSVTAEYRVATQLVAAFDAGDDCKTIVSDFQSHAIEMMASSLNSSDAITNANNQLYNVELGRVVRDLTR